MLINIKISMKTFFCISFCCFFLLANSQNTIKKDSLSHYTFNELSEKFYASKPDSLRAVLFAKYYINKAKLEKDTLQTAEGNYYLSDITKDSIYFVGYWNDIIKLKKKSVNKLYPIIAFIELGDYHLLNGKINKALKNYLLAEKFISINKNDSLKYINKVRLGMLKSRNGDLLETLRLFRQAYSYYLAKKQTNSNEYYSLLLNLSSTYIKTKNYDSAYYFNKKLYNLSLKTNDLKIIGYTLYTGGKIDFKRKNYEKAIKKLKKAIPHIIDDENYLILSYVYFAMAHSYKELNDIDNSLNYYNKVDSLFLTTKNYHHSQKSAYKYLISHYKDKKNDVKQLIYINKYITVDSVLNARAKSINKNLTENYDIPNLLAEKKGIENRLKEDVSAAKKWALGIGTFSFLLSIFLIQQYRKRRLYKQRFQKLMNSPTQEANLEKKTTVKKETTIPKETVKCILILLEQFEFYKQYLSSEITLSSLAKTFETNSTYLSQVINQHKGKSFNSYINQLRINYTAEKLKTDSIFRRYSIKAIAGEVGFNTTESFSKAFYKNTGIKPSFFIKELEKK
ncbi:MAG: AraC-like DNA-binding protein [Polaribacter sp.]|jgi:AraC-like DNA-binding protein